jgi:hypothetical protein
MTLVPDVAQVASAAFAAVAAGAAWRTVSQARQAAEAGIRPELAVSVERGSGGDLDVLVWNAGRGIARDVQIALVAEGLCVVDRTRAVLESGGGFRIQTSIALPGALHATPAAASDRKLVVSCREIRQRTWAWDPDGNCKELPRAKQGQESPKAAFALFWPHIDLAAAEPAHILSYRFGAPAIDRVVAPSIQEGRGAPPPPAARGAVRSATPSPEPDF